MSFAPTRTPWAPWACAFVLLLTAGAARAVDGVLEIHPACVAGGCFPGDAGGFPVEITASGSYRLTANLELTGDASAILVQADDVTIDLNGFAIHGPTTCTFGGGAVTCDSTSEAAGVSGPAASGVTVRNGVIRGMGGRGVDLGADATLADLLLESNGRGGAVLASGRAAGVTARVNDDDGIHASGTLDVTGCLAAQNSVGGFVLGRGTVAASSAVDNLLGGILCFERCTVTGNHVDANGNAGIFIGNAGTVRGNLVTGNVGAGLQVAGVTGYAENTFQDNAGGAAVQVSGTGAVETGTNVCQGDTTCP